MKRLSIFFCVAVLATATASAATTEVYATNIDAGGTDLRWHRYVPIGGGPTWPAAVVVVGGRWKNMTSGPANVAQDLANNGFLAFAIEYRRAPPHTAMSAAGPPGDGQQDPPSDGRPPEQTDDVQRAIRAARADSQCSGKVVVLGFSSGAEVGGWWVISGTANDDRADAFVGSSGIYDLDNSDMLAGANHSEVENYINHTIGEGTPFHTAAQAASPYWLTVSSTPAPALLFNSSAEEIPASEFSTMVTKLTNAGGTIESHLLTGSVHGSDYWYLSYGGSFSTVKDCAIDFLNRMLSVAQTPAAPARIALTRK